MSDPDIGKEHVILVAVVVEGATRAEAEHRLHNVLPPVRDDAPDSPVTSWWIAEDDRRDRSENDSAVFVDKGRQQDAHDVLADRGFTSAGNSPERYLDGQPCDECGERIPDVGMSVVNDHHDPACSLHPDNHQEG